MKAVRGVSGADTRQMIMSDTAMLQMYMLEVVLSSDLLVEIIVSLHSSYLARSLPCHGEKDEHVANDACRDDETIDQ